MARRSPAQQKQVFPLWLRWLLPSVLILIWFGLGGVGGPTFGKLDTVSSNDQASFLPTSADSTKARDWQTKFAESKSIPAIVVLESDAKLTATDLSRFLELASKLGEVEGVQQPEAPAPTAVAGPIPSKDGRAVEYIVPIADTDHVKVVVADIRQAVAEYTSDSVKGYVTGPAGLSADLVKAFGGIDGLLLLVAVSAVFIILVVVYRSVLLPVLVLLTALFALCAAILVIFLMGKAGWITLNGQSQGILSILVIGAATDYSLLLVARFREALEHTESKWTALVAAWRSAFEPIAASAATVVVALLCLLFSDLGSNRGLGPVAATGIVFAFLASLSFLPALLAVFGRAAFWPAQPRVHSEATTPSRDVALGLDGVTGIWRALGHLIARRPWFTWFTTAMVLAVCVIGLWQLRASGVAQTKLILTKSEAVDGQAVLADHFDAGSGSPVVIITDESRAQAVLQAVQAAEGVSTASLYIGNVNPASPAARTAQPVTVEGRQFINATLLDAADSTEAEVVVRQLRRDLPAADAGVLVGGVTATAIDTNDTARRDLTKIIPIVLVVILVILMLLLRSILAPVLLIGTVVLSYAATLGVSALVFNHIFNFPGADASVPLFGFVFLVALGIDYNIFLMTRVREEAIQLGTRPGILQALGKTGGVITSAGVVLAATFAALGVIPILFLAQIAFIVAFGVLLDTVVVRSLLVPALAYDLGRVIWWPSRLSRQPDTRSTK